MQLILMICVMFSLNYFIPRLGVGKYVHQSIAAQGSENKGESEKEKWKLEFPEWERKRNDE